MPARVVADGLGALDGDGAHLGDELARTPGGRRGLLDDLLVAALDRAVALEDVDHVAVAIAEHLDLDVTRAEDGLLDVDGVVAEELLRLAAGALPGAGHLVLGVDEAHALAAAARAAALSMTGKPIFFAAAIGFVGGVAASRQARSGRRPPPSCRGRRVFEPIWRIALAGGPMNVMPACSQASAKSGFSLRKP